MSELQHGSPWAAGEQCQVCQQRAVHKVGEEDGPPDQHNWTSYLCCRHFGEVMGVQARVACNVAENATEPVCPRCGLAGCLVDW
jgi:hypothetical protein